MCTFFTWVNRKGLKEKLKVAYIRSLQTILSLSHLMRLVMEYCYIQKDNVAEEMKVEGFDM